MAKLVDRITPPRALAAYLLLAVAAQCAAGNIALAWWAFPVNAAALALLLAVLWIWWRERPGSPWLRALGSGGAAVAALALVAAGSLVKGLVPADAADPGLLGHRDFTTSWIFAAAVALLMANLVAAMLLRWGARRLRWRFMLNHAGALLAAASLFFGSADTRKWYAKASRGQEIAQAVDLSGAPRRLSPPLRLEDFRVDFSPSGAPAAFHADVERGGERRRIRVNHPWRWSAAEDIYLNGYDAASGAAPAYVVLEIVRQPWKHATLAGVLMMMAGAALLFAQGKGERRPGGKEARP